MKNAFSLSNLLPLAVMAALLAAMTVPVIGVAKGVPGASGQSTGPLSAALLFAFIAPICMMATQTLSGRLTALTVVLFSALGARVVVDFLDDGQFAAAGLTILVMIGAWSLLGLGLRLRARNRAEKTRKLAHDAVALIKETTKALRVRYAAPSFRPQAVDAPIHVLNLAESLALGVIWQAATGGDATEFARTAQQDLHDMRNDLYNNKVTDPNGYTAAVVDLYLKKIGKMLRSRGFDVAYLRAANSPDESEIAAARDRAPQSAQPDDPADDLAKSA